MSQHSYARCWVHLVWATLNREPRLAEQARKRVSRFLSDYAESKGIFIRTNYVNTDHAHVLVDLSSKYSIEDMAHLLKGSSSHWINESKVTPLPFAWQRGYGGFSVSHSATPDVALYIAKQGVHHAVQTFRDELHYLVEHHDLRWYEET